MSKPLVPHATLPNWFLLAANDACINTKELCAIYSVSKATLWRWIAQGIIPAPDFKDKGHSGHHPIKPAFRWKVSSLRKIIKAQNENH